jgi:putative oxidoreductase
MAGAFSHRSPFVMEANTHYARRNAEKNRRPGVRADCSTALLGATRIEASFIHVWPAVRPRRKHAPRTNEDPLTIGRIALGLVFFAHGAQKMLGWFGGTGFSETIAEFAKTGMPTALALFAIFVEFFGSLSLLFGLLSRAAALAIIIEMIGAVLTVHIHNGFFMNWMGHQKGEGFEYHIIAVALAFVILVRGAGALSIDRLVSSRESRAALDREVVDQTSHIRTR